MALGLLYVDGPELGRSLVILVRVVGFGKDDTTVVGRLYNSRRAWTRWGREVLVCF